MINEKLFNETIDKLVKAYFEGTLEHGHCLRCAVGNIVGDNNWAGFFMTIEGQNGYRQIRRQPLHGFPNYQYPQQDLMDIEWAFETAPKEGDWEFNGLMAVVDVLERIHECDKETTTATKQRFVKATP